MIVLKQCRLILLLILICAQDIAGDWETWWTYDGIAGPSFWGLINPDWSMCSKGKIQSPINIETRNLLFDPLLKGLKIESNAVNGTLQNTGQSLLFQVNKENKGQVKFSEGPLLYNYQFEGINFHYGLNDSLGSEHQINGNYFPGEIQFYGFNKDLYHNMSEAQQKPKGVVVISTMVQIGESTTELRLITSALTKVAFKGESHPIKYDLMVSSLLPDTKEYITYEGSFTQPGCWESVVWIIYNKPIYMTKQQMYTIRRLMRGTKENPKAPLGYNARPIQPSHRTIRTNIKPKRKTGTKKCSYEYTETKSEDREKEYLALILVN